MTWKEVGDLIVALLGIVAWPSVVLVVLLKYKPQLGELISLIEQIRVKGFGMSLDATVKKINTEAESLAGEDPASATPPDVTFIDDPRITVLNSWANVQELVHQLASRNQDRLGRSTNRMAVRSRINLLRKAGIIDPHLGGLLLDMGGIRNQIAHGRDVEIHPETVKFFAEAASRVEAILEQQLDDLSGTQMTDSDESPA